MILVLNAGSSSLKWALYDSKLLTSPAHSPVKKGTFQGVGERSAERSAAAAVRQITERISGFAPLIQAVTYRLVHGGGIFAEPVKLDKKMLSQLKRFIPLAPSHLPVALEVIGEGERQFRHSRHIGVFDTAFFHALPLASQILPIPWEWTKRFGIRRFGFHGFSHRAAARRAIEVFRRRHPRKESAALRIITVHLGQGISIAALRGMHPRDTTMGFTPNDGVMMIERSGALDPGLVEFLLLRYGKKVFSALGHQGGVSAIAGTAEDMREILWTAGYPVTDAEWVPPSHRVTPPQRERARLAMAIFSNALVKAIAGYIGLLGGVDVICFAGSIGSNSAWLRESLAAQLKKIASFYMTSVVGGEEYEMALEGWGYLKNMKQ